MDSFHSVNFSIQYTFEFGGSLGYQHRSFFSLSLLNHSPFLTSAYRQALNLPWYRAGRPSLSPASAEAPARRIRLWEGASRRRKWGEGRVRGLHLLPVYNFPWLEHNFGGDERRERVRRNGFSRAPDDIELSIRFHFANLNNLMHMIIS